MGHATTVKAWEVVVLAPGDTAGRGDRWQAAVQSALTRWEPRCTTVVDDRMAIVEQVVANPRAPGDVIAAKRVAVFIEGAGVSSNRVFTEPVSLQDARQRHLADQEPAAFASLGAVRVELVCTSAR